MQDCMPKQCLLDCRWCTLPHLYQAALNHILPSIQVDKARRRTKEQICPLARSTAAAGAAPRRKRVTPTATCKSETPCPALRGVFKQGLQHMDEL
jgi:hypothetical protein